MNRPKITTFYIKTLALSVPFVLLVGYYFVRDPFMVIRDYKDYDHSRVMQNEGYTSWKKYKLYKDSMHYDAFIMGNSCTRAYTCAEWNKHIGAHPYRMFCNNIGIGNLLQTLEALDRQSRQEIKHLLIILDRPAFINHHVVEDAMHIMPEEVSHRSWSHIQGVFLQAFLTPKIMVPYIRYDLTGEVVPSTKDVVSSMCPTRTRYTNDAITPEDLIGSNGGKRQQEPEGNRNLKSKPCTVSAPLLWPAHERVLRRIREICDKHHTTLRLVIGPCADRISMNPKDIAVLKKILGPDCVFDYTRDNKWTDSRYFYDACHYRKIVGKGIMDEIYGAS